MVYGHNYQHSHTLLPEAIQKFYNHFLIQLFLIQVH
nr:MAG TPA: hypothetical protein [Crassvirales sp.]